MDTINIIYAAMVIASIPVLWYFIKDTYLRL